MTLENRRKRYAHFLKIGNTEAAKELADKYPDVKELKSKSPSKTEK